MQGTRCAAVVGHTGMRSLGGWTASRRAAGSPPSARRCLRTVAPTIGFACACPATKAAISAFASGRLATKSAIGAECLALPVGWSPASHGCDGDPPADGHGDLGE